MVDPTALVDAIQAFVDSAPLHDTSDVAEMYAVLDADSELVDGPTGAPTDRMARLYRHLDLSLRYQADEQAVHMRAGPRVDSAGVRGGTCALTTRLVLS